MAFKDLGPDVSQSPEDLSTGGQFSGEDRAYESVVIQEGKPVIDWEMNLRSEVDTDYGFQRANQRFVPSGWLIGDFLETSDGLGSYVPLTPIVGNENQINILSATLNVNGWSLKFEFSETSTIDLNELNLPTPPAGGSRTDLVVLEVWRALIAPVSSVANKSPTGLILRHGNVKALDPENLTDDLLDPNFAQESTKRVQIQYRYRVIEGVDMDTFPDGLDDPTVVANTVSDFTGPGADGAVTVLTYSPVSDDAGLWRAGAGDSTDAGILGTIDGRIYAIPVCAVFRRNTTAFDRDTNLNGGVLIVSGTSDRPDGLFSDQIVIEDVRDLRKTVIWDAPEALQKGSQQLLDNTLDTQHETIAGAAGTAITAKEDIGLGGHIDDSDQVRIRFSDRAIAERIVARIDIVGAVASVVIPLTAVPIAQAATLISIDVDTNSPAGTRFTAVNEVRRIDFAGPPVSDLPVSFGAGAGDIDSIIIVAGSITIAFAIDSLPNISLFIDITIEYPPDFGIGRNVLEEFQVWTPTPAALPAWVDASQYTTDPVPSDATRSELSTARWDIDRLHREASISLITTTQTYAVPAIDDFTVKIPERIDSLVLINGGAVPIGTVFTFNDSYTTITIGGGGVAFPSTVTVEYVAIRALPVTAGAPIDSYQIFYRTRAIQSVSVPTGDVTLELIPRYVINELAIISVGSGSPDDSFPFTDPSSQISVSSHPIIDFPEARLDSPATVGITGFASNTGFLQPPTIVPYVPNPAQVTLERMGVDDSADSEGRNYWSRGVSTFYLPSAFTYPLQIPTRHKNALFTIMEVKADSSTIARKGTYFLVVFSKWNELVMDNEVTMLADPSDSGVSVYRLRGNPLNPRRTQP